MNGDLSLTQSLGGLRIANPDTEDPASPPAHLQSQSQSQSPSPSPEPEPEPAQESLADGQDAVHRRPSQASSNGTVTERQKPVGAVGAAGAHSYTLAPPTHDPVAAEPQPQPQPQLQSRPSPALSSRALAPYPPGASPPQSSSPLGHASPLTAVSSSSSSSHSPRLAHRQSMPLAHQAQQQVPYPPYAPPPLMQQRNGPQPQALAQSMRERPISTSMYNHPNLSTSSATAPGTYRYNDEGLTSDIRRTSSSRVTASPPP